MFLMPFSAFSYTSYIFLHFFSLHTQSHSGIPLSFDTRLCRKKAEKRKQKQTTNSPAVDAQSPVTLDSNERSPNLTHSLPFSGVCDTTVWCITQCEKPILSLFFWFFSLVMVVVLSKVLGFRTPYHWPRPTQSVVHRTNFLFCESVSVNCQIGAFQMLPPLLLYGSSLHTSTTGSGCYGSKSEDHHFMSTPYNSFLTHTAASLLTALLLLPLPYILYFALCSTILHFYA